MKNDELKLALERKLEEDHLSLRRLETLCGVSASTLSRFINGLGDLTYNNSEKIHNWLNGKQSPKPKVLSCKRMRVGRKTFIVTIEEVAND